MATPLGKTSDQIENPKSVIVDALRDAILEQAISAGTRLPEDVIGKQFGVSRTIARSAMVELASEGLVELRPNRGAIVQEPNWSEATDTFDLRIALEEIVVSRLAGALSDEQAEQLRAHVRLEEEARQSGDESHSIRLAGEFHTLLAEFTESEILIRYMRELTSRCCLILSLFSRPHSSDCAVSEHLELIELLQRNDAEAARNAMTAHLKSVVGRALIKPVKKQSGSVEDILAIYAGYRARV
jgi:DNA-binding GntR family transcriptional regulator